MTAREWAEVIIGGLAIAFTVWIVSVFVFGVWG